MPTPLAARIPVVVYIVLFGVMAAIGAGVLALPFLFPAVRDGRLGEAATQAAVSALKRSAFQEAAVRFGEAQTAFAGAQTKLSSPALIPARLIPVLARQINTARTLAAGGVLAAQAGRTAARAFAASPPSSWHLSDGAFDLEAM